MLYTTLNESTPKLIVGYIILLKMFVSNTFKKLIFFYTKTRTGICLNILEVRLRFRHRYTNIAHYTSCTIKERYILILYNIPMHIRANARINVIVVIGNY